MNPEILLHICKYQSSVLNMPIRIYFDNKIAETFDPNFNPLAIDLTLPYLEQLYATDQPINYCITSDLLTIGMVKDKFSPFSLIIGPASTIAITESIARKLITSDNYPLKLDQVKELSQYLFNLPYTPIDRFLNILCLLHGIINHEILTSDAIITSEVEYDIEKEIEHNMLEQDEKTTSQGLQRRNPHDYEKEMLYCIKNGLTSRLKKLDLKGDVSQTGALALDTLRHYKNAIIILNTLSIRASISGGLSPETAYQLGEIYIRKIEACLNLKQLSDLSSAIRIDYCERVRELHFPHFYDPGINKAVHYINENVHKKITAEEIADVLFISKEYLSTRFKQVTGTTLPEYINHQKILEAKRLLRLTDKPLSEISEYLSFSSQSYFQNVFKKLVSLTPMEYRNNPEKDSD